MVRAEFSVAANTLTLRLDGRFVGEFAENVRSLVARCKVPSRLVIDLTDMTCIDIAGEEVLTWLGSIGGKFVCGNCASSDICERLRLPLISRRIDPLHLRVNAHTPAS
jgi:hypothetical protein